MDEQQQKAFDFAQETSKQLIGLATGVIGLTVTFAKDFYGGVQGWPRGLAIASWVLLLLSVASGLLTLMALTGSLEPVGPQAGLKPTIRGSNVIGPARFQVVLFFLGLLLAVVFGVVAGGHPAR